MNEGGERLELSGEASPAAGDSAVTRAQLDRWAAIYGTEHRQLRRWIQRGKDRSDPCPLDDATKMPAWVESNLDKVRSELRDRVNAAAATALAALAAAGASAPVSATASQDPVVSESKKEIAKNNDDGQRATAPAGEGEKGKASAPGVLLAPLDLATVGGVEGESVEFFRTIFAAVKLQLEAAYLKGEDSEIRKLHARLKDVAETLRKNEKDAEQRAIRLEAYLDKAEVFNEVTEALNTLSQMRELRGKRLRSELADLPPDLLERIGRELDDIGRREEDVLRNLSAMKTADDVSLKLAA